MSITPGTGIPGKIEAVGPGGVIVINGSEVWRCGKDSPLFM